MWDLKRRKESCGGGTPPGFKSRGPTSTNPKGGTPVPANFFRVALLDVLEALHSLIKLPTLTANLRLQQEMNGRVPLPTAGQECGKGGLGFIVTGKGNSLRQI